MENPEAEIPGVVRALVQNASVRRQRETIQKFFTEDCELIHPLVSAKSRQGMEAIFVIRSFLLIHWSCDIIRVSYDEKKDPLRLEVEVLQHCRPWWTPLRLINHSTLTVLDLRQVFNPKNEKVVMQIRKQHDYFVKSMAFSEIPVFGIFYEWVIETGIVGSILSLFYSVTSFLMDILSSIFGS